MEHPHGCRTAWRKCRGQVPLFLFLWMILTVDNTFGDCNVSSTSVIADETYRILTSPDDPNGFSLGHHCAWNLTANSSNFIQVTFEFITLENVTTNEETCPQRFRISDVGHWLHRGVVVCWYERQVFSSESNQVQIQDTSRKPNERIAVTIGYQAIDNQNRQGCHFFRELIADETYRVLTSPNYPDTFIPTNDCEWKITGDLNFVQLYFEVMDLDNETDWIAVSTGYMDSISMSKLPSYQNYTSLDNYAYIKLRTFLSGIPIRFKIGYRATDEYDFEWGCRKKDVFMKARNSSKMITSPGYPNGFPNKCIVQWFINTHLGLPNQLLTFTILDVDLDNSTTCDQAYVNISKVLWPRDHHDCSFTPSNPLQLCDSSSPLIGKTLGVYYYDYSSIEFISTSSSQSGGFKITYKTEDACDNYCTSHRIKLQADSVSRSITSPRYPDEYPLLCQCRWEIKSEKDIVQLTVEDVDLENCTLSDPCWSDYFAILDYDLTRPLCELMKSPYSNTYYSRSDTVTVRFESDSIRMRMGRGIKFSYQARDFGDYPVCSVDMLPLNASEVSKELRPPGNIEGHVNPSRCHWLITSEMDTIQLTIVSIDFGNSLNDSKCEKHFIEIYDGKSNSAPRLLPKTCRKNSSLTTFESSSKFVYIHFQSDGLLDSTGFEIDYVAISNAESGKLLSVPAIIGISISVVAGIACIVIVVVFIVKCRPGLRMKKKEAASPNLSKLLANSSF